MTPWEAQDTGEAMIREELVLRVAILAERFSPNLHWYVDTILKLMTLAGDYVSDQVRSCILIPYHRQPVQIAKSDDQY